MFCFMFLFSFFFFKQKTAYELRISDWSSDVCSSILRVASFALGLFVFLALWGVIDAGIYQLTLGRAMDALAEMRSNAVATNAWLLAPSAAQKALAIFGSFRTAAAGLAGAFVFTVFRFSGNVFTSFTSGSLG